MYYIYIYKFELKFFKLISSRLRNLSTGDHAHFTSNILRAKSITYLHCYTYDTAYAIRNSEKVRPWRVLQYHGEFI